MSTLGNISPSQKFTCSVCQEEISIGDQKNILNDDLLLNLGDCDKNADTAINSKSMKLRYAIELIVNCNISWIDKESVYLCKMCFEKIELCVKFRAKLLTSLGTLTDQQNVNLPTCALDHRVTKPITTNKISEANTTTSNKPSSCTCEHATLCGNSSENMKCLNLNKTKSLKSNINMIEEINIDDSSVLLDLNDLSHDESDTNDSLNIDKLHNNKEDNINDSEYSNDNLNMCTYKKILAKVQENDIESDIDVCSGEDDEVLELDIQCRKDETVEIESSESDIEVCDYEPTGKRIKSYNTLFSPVYF